MAYDPFAHPVQLEGQGIDPPCVFFDEFNDGWGFEANDTDNTGKFSETADIGAWFVSVIDGDTDSAEVIKVSDGEPGGVLTVTSNNKDNDSMNLQVNGEAFQVLSGRDITFKAKLKIASTTVNDWVIGLADPTTEAVVGTGMTDFIGFHGGTTILAEATGSANIIASVGTGMAGDWTSTSTQNALDTDVDYVADTFFTVGFRVMSNSAVKFYVNGALVHKSTTLLPSSVGLSPVFCIKANSAAAATMEIDYIYCRQDR
jgi:hypothetical protein